MEEEKNNLDITKEKISEIIDDTDIKLHHLGSFFNNKEEMLEEKFRLEGKIEKLTNSQKKPYFARIDFSYNTKNEKYYIGKIGISDYDNNIVVIDWRAPISTLYYDSNIGNASYTSPEGTINGTLTKKRQYEIENGQLLSYNDVDTVSNDELLKPYLNASADNRLKNIVSTIQGEQNAIIRENQNKNLIIQGVAGSGKTTVALHRIAYLVYTYKDIYKPSDYMVIGPNKFFVKYISNILPDLDVDNVNEFTTEEILNLYLKESFIINNKLDKIKEYDEISNYKTSLLIKQDIDNYFLNLKVLPEESFKIDNCEILSKSYIQETYDSINKNIHKSIRSQIDKMILYLSKYINSNLTSICSKLIKNNINNKTIQDFKANPTSYLKKYFKILNLNSKDIYIELLKNNNLNYTNIKKNIIDIEDISPLLYIRYLLVGDNIFDNIKHIVIDEAQDYGILTFYVFKLIFKNATFSIYGDLAQSLYSYRSIKTWNEIEPIFNNLEIKKLNKSYRTTIEIMNEANKINIKLNLDEAIPVIRHGKPVIYTNENIIDILNKNKELYNSIAIITKDNYEAQEVYQSIKDKFNIDLITSDNLDYKNNINIMPSYLAKGLEFDLVIINNINNFKNDNINDLKLLYVSMTRALHELIIKD